MITGAELRTLLGSPVAFHRIFAQVGGSVNAGLFLSQLFYWSDKGDDPDGWIYKTHKEWTREVMLTRQEQITARKHLVGLGIVQERLSKTVPPVLHYRLDFHALAEAIRAVSEGANNQLFASKQSNVENEQADWLLANNLYNTEITTEITTESRVSNAHAQGKAGTIPADRAPVLPDFAFMGMERKPTANGSHAPEKVVVNDGGWEWAQAEGWRGDRPGLQLAANMCLDYYRGNGKRMIDWKATLRNWIRRNIQRGEDMTSTGPLAGPKGGGGINGNGQGNGVGPGPGRQEARYGYNSRGEPTNKVTSLTEAARYLAERNEQRVRGAGQPADGDVITLSDDEWRSR